MCQVLNLSTLSHRREWPWPPVRLEKPCCQFKSQVGSWLQGPTGASGPGNCGPVLWWWQRCCLSCTPQPAHLCGTPYQLREWLHLTPHHTASRCRHPHHNPCRSGWLGTTSRGPGSFSSFATGGVMPTPQGTPALLSLPNSPPKIHPTPMPPCSEAFRPLPGTHRPQRPPGDLHTLFPGCSCMQLCPPPLLHSASTRCASGGGTEPCAGRLSTTPRHKTSSLW